MSRRTKVAALAFVIAAPLAGCGAMEKRDASHATSVDRSAPEVVAFPNDFSNVANKCAHRGWRAFVTTHGGDKDSGNMVIVKDPTCR